MTKALGTDDSINTCDCCGKTNLKYTVTIELDDGEIVHYGCVCARRNTGKTQSTITKEINTHAAAQLIAAQNEFYASAEYIAERAQFAARDEFARRTGTRMLGLIAMEFVREACQAADSVRRTVAAKYSVPTYRL